MSFQTFEITAGMKNIRLMGRMDLTQSPLALDWTGSGMEFRFRRGSGCIRCCWDWRRSRSGP